MLERLGTPVVVGLAIVFAVAVYFIFACSRTQVARAPSTEPGESDPARPADSKPNSVVARPHTQDRPRTPDGDTDQPQYLWGVNLTPERPRLDRALDSPATVALKEEFLGGIRSPPRDKKNQ